MANTKKHDESLSTSKELGRSERPFKNVNLNVEMRLSTIGSFIESISSDTPTTKSKRKSKEHVKERTVTSKECPTFLRSRITLDVQATRKGGDFDLPGGARLKIPEGLYAKKESITIALVPPNKRHEYCPTMKPYEKLASNVYLIHAKSTLKGKIDLNLPSLLPEPENIVALYKPPNEPWHEIKNITKIDDQGGEPVVFHSDGLTVQTSEQGAYTLMEKPLEESFAVTPNGSLHHSRINRCISVRIPKRCTTYDGDCVLKIFKVDDSRIDRARIMYQRQCSSVQYLSAFYDFSFPESDSPAVFKRPVTLKLPLPEWVASLEEDDEAPDLTVMMLKDHHWEILETPLKTTKTSVAFDTTVLTRFCLINPRKDCRVRAHLSMPRLEQCNQVIGGDILMFAMLEARTWYLMAECVRQSHVVEVISERVKKGFTFLRRIPVAPITEEKNDRKNLRSSSRYNSNHFPRTESRFQKSKLATHTEDQFLFAQPEEELELRNSAVYLVSLEGDLRFKEKSSEEGGPDSEAADNTIHLQFHELFQDNYRFVEIEPKPEMKDKAEALFLETVAAQRAKEAKEKEEAKERELLEKKAAAMARVNHGARSPLPAEALVKQNGVREAPGEPYAAPLPSPTAPSDLSGDLQSCATEEDAEIEMAKHLVSSCVSCRWAPSYGGDADLPTNGEPPPEAGPIFARYPLLVDVQDVIDYFAFEAPPEVDPEAEAKAKAKAEAEEMAEAKAKAEAEAKKVKKAEEKEKKAKGSDASFQRLTTTTKKAPTIIKDPKVLSGRSLQVLSSYVQNGLALAVHLNLPDSVITGIGFDSLSNLHALSDVTYKVLLHWKRTYDAKRKEEMVPDLCAALKELELVGAAAVIADRHRNNLELSPGCFNF